MTTSSLPAAGHDRFIKDTRFGSWLVTSDVWAEHVVRVALAELTALAGPRLRRSAAILDVGCGGGRALPLLAEAFAPSILVGVDPDPEMLALAGEVAARCFCRVELKVGHAEALDLPDGAFDTIFCHQTLHHVPDPPRAVGEFHRVLRPGGVLLLGESCAPFIRSRLVRLLFRHPMEAQMQAHEYLDLLRAVGFECPSDSVATPYPWWSRPDLGALEWLGRPVRADHPHTVLDVAAVKR